MGVAIVVVVAVDAGGGVYTCSARQSGGYILWYIVYEDKTTII